MGLTGGRGETSYEAIAVVQEGPRGGLEEGHGCEMDGDWEGEWGGGDHQTFGSYRGKGSTTH